jgi:hypothetical protein
MLLFAAGTRLLREKQVLGDPTGLMLEEAPGPPARRCVPGAEINSSTKKNIFSSKMNRGSLVILKISRDEE